MNYRYFIFLICLLISSKAIGQTDKPNIVMIVTHDIGRHIGCYGVETVQTPNMDRLASQGMKFNGIYSTSAVCTPGRASLHTGPSIQWTDGTQSWSMVVGVEF